jgi:hypothetical protein
MRNMTRTFFFPEDRQVSLSAVERVASSFADLCDAPADDFQDQLKVVAQEFRLLSFLKKFGASEEALNSLLLDCFAVNSLGDPFFRGDFQTAHKAMCLSALLYKLGWDELSAEAQAWAAQMQVCNVPPTLASTGPLDIEKSRSLMMHLVRLEDHGRASAAGFSHFTDPFIGM